MVQPKLSEKAIKKEFDKFKKQLVKENGNRAMFDDRIDDICKPLFKARWQGVHTQDRTQLKTGYQIINTSVQGENGKHWVALYITPKTCYVYDSYGRPTADILKVMVKKMKGAGIKYKDSDPDMEQTGFTSECCGQNCISWLMCVKKYGIRNALRI